MTSLSAEIIPPCNISGLQVFIKKDKYLSSKRLGLLKRFLKKWIQFFFFYLKRKSAGHGAYKHFLCWLVKRPEKVRLSPRALWMAPSMLLTCGNTNGQIKEYYTPFTVPRRRSFSHTNQGWPCSASQFRRGRTFPMAGLKTPGAIFFISSGWGFSPPFSSDNEFL